MPTTLTAKLKLTTTPEQFAALRATQLISSFGSNLTTVALLYQIFVLTHSPTF